MGVLFALFALFGWGLSDFLAALTSRKVGNVPTAFWLTAGGLILMFGYSFFIHASFILPFSAISILLLAGIIQSLGGISFYKALTIGKVSLASPIGSSWAAWTTLLSILFLHERLTPLQSLAVIIVILGTFFVSTDLRQLMKSVEKGFADKGVFLALLASVFWGVSWVFYVPILHTYGWLPSVIGLRIAILIGVGLFAIVFKQTIFFKPKKQIIWLFLCMPFVDVAAYFGYSIGLEHGLTAIVSPVAAAFPLVTVVLAKIVLKEKVVLNQFLGIVAIIGGVILLSI